MPSMENPRKKIEGPARPSDSGEKPKPIDLSKEHMPKIDRNAELQKLRNPKSGLM